MSETLHCQNYKKSGKQVGKLKQTIKISKAYRNKIFHLFSCHYKCILNDKHIFNSLSINSQVTQQPAFCRVSEDILNPRNENQILE